MLKEILPGLFYNTEDGTPWSANHRNPDKRPRAMLLPLSAKNTGNYRVVWVNGGLRRWHHVVWEHFIGPIPEGMQIDHLNNDRSDDRIENLRLTTPEDNHRCSLRYRNNTSGYPGVSWHKPSRKWACKIGHKGRRKHLGLFDDPVTAYEAYLEAKRALHGPHTIRRDYRDEALTV